jgi:hypothetical protein
MKTKKLKTGMIFRNKNYEGYYEIADIINDTINGYKRNIITLGNVQTQEVAIKQELGSDWEHIEGASIGEETVVIKKVLFKGEKAPQPVKKEKTTIINKIVEVQKPLTSEIKTQAQHKEAREGKTNAMTHAFANAKISVRENKKLSKKDKEELKEYKKNEKDELVYDRQFYFKMMKYTHDDLYIMGMILGRNHELVRFYSPAPKQISKQVHLSELQCFREGMTLGQIRMLGNRIKAHSPEQIGTPVTPQSILRRLLKSIYNYGTEEEKRMLMMN